ncbi:hypothetical protein CB1_000627004 [Camelus ferus]|nr:hypothetical protein CB1_000627004 [Camelus ferus]
MARYRETQGNECAARQALQWAVTRRWQGAVVAAGDQGGCSNQLNKKPCCRAWRPGNLHRVSDISRFEVLPNLVYTEFVKLKKYGSLKNSYSQQD